MYSDDNTWRLHYEDWKRVVRGIKTPVSVNAYEPTKEQTESRIRTINALIIDYEVDHNNNHERGL